MEEKTLEPGAEARRRPQRAGGGGPSQDRETGAADTAYANSQPTPTRSLCEPNPPRPVSSEDPFSPGYTHSIMEPAPKNPFHPAPLAGVRALQISNGIIVHLLEGSISDTVMPLNFSRTVRPISSGWLRSHALVATKILPPYLFIRRFRSNNCTKIN